jgi:hypothetical protein
VSLKCPSSRAPVALKTSSIAEDVLIVGKVSGGEK